MHQDHVDGTLSSTTGACIKWTCVATRRVDQDVDSPVRNVRDSVQGISFHVIEFLGFDHQTTAHR